MNFTSCISPAGDGDALPYWFVFQGDRMVVRPAGDTVELPRATSLEQLQLVPLRQVYLGYLEDTEGGRTDCYGAEIPSDAVLPEDMIADGLHHALFSQLDDLFIALAGRAVQLVTWQRTHQFCGQCGTRTEELSHERARRCPNCDLIGYPRLSPAIIIAVVRRTEQGKQLLLARNHRFPPGRYSVIAGYVEPGESLEECAEREVCEEVGIQIEGLRYFGSQPWPFPNSLMIGFTAEYAGGELVLEEAELADANWFAPDALPNLPPRTTIARRLIDWFLTEA